jgi:protein-tyrosine phosphatase
MTKKINYYNETDYRSLLPDLWSEIIPGLFMGGIAEACNIEEDVRLTKEHFDTVVTLHAWSQPVDWYVREIRQTFHDGDTGEINTDDLKFLVDAIEVDLSKGKKVFVRCLSGINRSGLVVALVLIRLGYPASYAISLIREKRSQWALCNEYFEQWIYENEKVDWWIK